MNSHFLLLFQSVVWKSHAKVELVNPLGYQYKSLSLQISFQKSLRLREEMHFSSSKQSLLCNRTWFFDRINGTIWPQSSWKYCSSQVNTLLKAWRHFPARFSLLQNAAVKVLAKFLCSPWNPIEKRCHSNYCINRIWACILLEEFNHFLFWGRSLWIQFSACKLPLASLFQHKLYMQENWHLLLNISAWSYRINIISELRRRLETPKREYLKNEAGRKQGANCQKNILA